MNTIIEKIRAEVERLKQEGDIALQDAVETNDIESGFVCGGIISTCEKLLTKLDTLQHYLATTPKEQIKKDWESLKEWGKVGPTVSEFLGWEQPVCDGLEEEIERYLSTEWELDEKLNKDEPIYIYDCTWEDLKVFARHFAKWQKEQMMKEAVDVEVIGEKRDLRIIDSTQRCLFNAKRGDWLKILIIKED